MNWWPFRRRNGRAAAEELELKAEAKLRAAKRMTKQVERMAPAIVAGLPPEEFARRVVRAYRGSV